MQVSFACRCSKRGIICHPALGHKTGSGEVIGSTLVWIDSEQTTRIAPSCHGEKVFGSGLRGEGFAAPVCTTLQLRLSPLQPWEELTYLSQLFNAKRRGDWKEEDILPGKCLLDLISSPPLAAACSGTALRQTHSSLFLSGGCPRQEKAICCR